MSGGKRVWGNVWNGMRSGECMDEGEELRRRGRGGKGEWKCKTVSRDDVWVERRGKRRGGE